MGYLEQTEFLDRELDVFLSDIKKIEKELMPQLDGLAKAMPEIYKGYAQIIRSIVNTGLEICQPNSKNACMIELAAEIGARSIKAYGEYKAAKQHNKLLQKYMMVKATYANNNLQMVEDLLPRITSLIDSTAKCFNKFYSIQYDLNDFTKQTIDRIAILQSKALNMHRTNVFLYELCIYLQAEYHAWIDGNQTSDYEMPDYYMINRIFIQSIYDNDLFSSFEKAAECVHIISGKQIMLLSDYQLSLMALGARPCKINENRAHPMVRRLLNNCGAHTKYAELLNPVLAHIEGDPCYIIIFFGILAFIGIICIEIFYIDADFTTKLIIASLSLGAIFKICYTGSRKARISYVRKGISICEQMDKTIESTCGKVDRQDVDYSEHNTIIAVVKGFLAN